MSLFSKQIADLKKRVQEEETILSSKQIADSKIFAATAFVIRHIPHFNSNKQFDSWLFVNYYLFTYMFTHKTLIGLKELKKILSHALTVRWDIKLLCKRIWPNIFATVYLSLLPTIHTCCTYSIITTCVGIIYKTPS